MWHLDALSLRWALEKGLEGRSETEDRAGGPSAWPLVEESPGDPRKDIWRMSQVAAWCCRGESQRPAVRVGEGEGVSLVLCLAVCLRPRGRQAGGRCQPWGHVSER